MADQPTITNSDTAELLTFNGVFRDRLVTAAIAQKIVKYTVLGEDTTNGDVIPMLAAGTDGEDNPRFIIMEEIDNSAGEAAIDVTVQVMVEGEIDKDLLVFQNGSDTIASTIVSGRTVENAMATEGLIVTSFTEESELDNQ